MAIYRSDQATVTFAAEAAQGGYPEVGAITSTVDAAVDTDAAIVPGQTTVKLDGDISASRENLKTLIIIGLNTAATGPAEVRRLVAGSGSSSITVDAPFAFAHPTNMDVYYKTMTENTADTLTEADGNKYITWLPGVYESVDCPDPEQAFEPRYILGNLTNRNFYQMYQGQETLAGSIGGMIMLNGFPLRFPLGAVISVPSAAAGTSIHQTGGNTYRQLGAAASKGDLYINVKTAATYAFAAGDYILFGNETSTPPVNAYYDSTSVRADGAKVNYEIRQIYAAVAADSANTSLQLSHPLQFDHDDNDFLFKIANAGAHVIGTTALFNHSVIEKVALDSMSWNVSIVDDADANVWQRRYIGGKVGSMTLSAEAGGLLTGGWDGVNFLDMVHNVRNHPNLPAARPMPRYAAMQPITSDTVGSPTYNGTFTSPTTSPYYFSQGVVKMFGEAAAATSAGDTVARLTSFNLSISNSTEPKYYVGAQYDGRRTPKEQFEGNREYTMSATIAADDSVAFGTDNARSLFRELLLAGDYRGTGTLGFTGFGINLKFTRDGDGGSDYIEFIIPAEGSTNVGGNAQGAFIRTAPHNIGDTNPVSADADIVFRSMKIQIKDYEPIYP